MAKTNNNDFAAKLKRRKIRKLIIILIVLAAIVGAGFFAVKKIQSKKATNAVSEVNFSQVTRGDIDVAITGSGTVEPNNRYEIIPMVNGEIVKCDYEVGDYVEKGTVIYDFDTEDADLTLAQAKSKFERSTLSYSETKRKTEKLTVTAPCSGVISDINVKAGESVSVNQQLATITNTSKLKVTLPFNENQMSKIGVGSAATLTSSEHMSSVTGKVSHVSSLPSAQTDGTVGYNVEIEFTNPGAFSNATILGGEVNGQISAGSGTVEYSETKTVSFDMAGDIASLAYRNGDYIKEGTVMATLSSKDLNAELTNAEKEYNEAKLSLEQQEKSMDDYHITAPISGTVLTKTSKAGDTIDKTNASVTMMVIADVSKLKFTLSIDELDIDKIKVGQEVDITADALEGQEFKGQITEISMEGTATNGVTTYAATVTIDSPGSLKPSMNVDATVLVQSAKNVLRVPTTDIKTAMGKHYVFLKDENAQPVETGKNAKKSKSDIREELKEEIKTGKVQSENGAAESAEDKKSGVPTAPAGFKTVEIQIGIQSDDFTEVVSGLNEGDQIYQQAVASSGNSMMAMMMGQDMGGGQGGGGDMGGGPGGGGAQGGGGGAAGGGGGPR